MYCKICSKIFLDERCSLLFILQFEKALSITLQGGGRVAERALRSGGLVVFFLHTTIVLAIEVHSEAESIKALFFCDNRKFNPHSPVTFVMDYKRFRMIIASV